MGAPHLGLPKSIYYAYPKTVFRWKQQQSKKSINVIFLSSKYQKLLDPISKHESSQGFLSHTEKGHLILIYSLHVGKVAIIINSFCLFCFYLQVT